MVLERYIDLGLETGSYGDGTGTKAGLIGTDSSESIDRGLIVEESLDSQVEKSAYGGSLKLSGSIGGTLRPKMLEPVLEAIWGTNTLSAGISNTYTLGQPKPLTMTLGEDTGIVQEARDFKGVGITKLGLTAKTDEFVKWTADYIAKDMDIGTFSAPTYVAEDPLIFDKAIIYTDGGTVPLTEVKSFSLDIERKLRTDWITLGNYKLHGLAMDGVSGLSGSLEFTELEYAEMKRAIFGTTAGTAFPVLNDIGTGILQLLLDDSSGSPAVEINLPVSKFGTSSRGASGRGEVTKSLTYKTTDGANNWITYL